jgi:hypothetical protein
LIAVDGVEIEERSFVAEGAPLDDSQMRFGRKDQRARRTGSFGCGAEDQRFNTESTEKCGRSRRIRNGRAGIEERSVVAEDAPLMTATYGLGGRSGIWRRSGSNNPTLGTSGEEWAPENAKATATPKATANAKVKWPG